MAAATRPLLDADADADADVDAGVGVDVDADADVDDNALDLFPLESSPARPKSRESAESGFGGRWLTATFSYPLWVVLCDAFPDAEASFLPILREELLRPRPIMLFDPSESFPLLGMVECV